MLLESKQSISDLISEEKVILCGNGDIVKANVDIERRVVHIGSAAHSEMESDMLSEGSKRGDLVGFNIFVDELSRGEMIPLDMVEFSSMINFDINKMRLNDLRSGYQIRDEEIKNKVMEVLNSWLVQ